MSDDEDSGPRKPFKPEYAFGTPIRQNIVYSDFAHLGPTMVGFGRNLAERSDGGDLAKKVEPMPKKKKIKRDKKNTPGLRPTSKAAAIPGEPNPGSEISEPCERPECKDVIHQILETQLKNEMERDDIVRMCEEAVLGTDLIEEECKELEETAKTINNEGATLEEGLAQLMEKLQKYEKRLSQQIQEKDELNNKAMALEMERQRLSRRSKEIESALSDALWSGKTTVSVVEKKVSSMIIAHTAEKALDPLYSSTHYGSLVREDIIDFTERPKTVTSVPHYLIYSTLNNAPITAVANRDYEAFGETKKIELNGSRRSQHGKGRISDLLAPSVSSPISHGKTLASLHTDERSLVSKGAIHKNKLDKTTITSNSSWQQLDPVLYQERARTSWGREKKLGKVRTSNDPPGYKRALLTSKGHPGIFNKDSLDEEDTAPISLGNTM